MTVARAARYQHLVEEAAKQFKCSPGSELARHVGTLRLARETFAERLISGKDVNPNDLIRLDDCLRQYLPLRTEPSEPLHLVVKRQRERQDRIQAFGSSEPPIEVPASIADGGRRNRNGSDSSQS